MTDSILKVIADNPALFDEVKAIIVAEFDTQEDELGFSNERLGERVRARLEGKATIESAFTKILAYKTPEVKPEKENPAR